MSFISRKGLLTITTVLDVAIHGNGRRVSGKELAARNTLPPRHLEPILQELVRGGILKGARGRHGGYELGRECQQITVEDILRATQVLEHVELPALGSPRLDCIVLPALTEAERLFSSALSRISIADLLRSARRRGAEELFYGVPMDG
jgi:Rrf2 family transcriptional regulator, iron-sulfur cluster assembly transcription factor